MGAFKSVLPEESLQLLINFDKAVAGAETLSTVGNIAFLRNFLRGEALQKYYSIIATFEGTKARHLQEIRN